MAKDSETVYINDMRYISKPIPKNIPFNLKTNLPYPPITG